MIAAKLEAVKAGEIDRLMLLLPPRHGKALEINTPIPTPNGFTPIGELRPGDTVFDDRGQTCTVTAVSPIWRGRDVFSVETDDGDVLIADGEHEWLVRLCRKNVRFELLTTAQIASRSAIKSFRAPMIAAQGTLDLPERKLPIDPYVLGVWLGDGRSDSAAMASADREIVEAVSNIEGGHNHYAKQGITYHFRAGPHYRKGAKQSETLQNRLRQLGLLKNKHVPDLYKWASPRQRLSCLQGLVDTDGYIAKDGQVEFCSTRKQLAEDVRDLVAGLGHKASIIEGRALLNGKDCGPKYRVMFYMAGAARLSRKAKRCRHGIRAFRRYISISPAGKADTVCIQVDSPSSMFLCGRSMLPTHNSELASKRFPAFYLGHEPAKQFIAVSATSELATDFGRDVRNTIASPQYRVLFDTNLAEDSQAKGKWHTSEGGIYYSVGVEGSILGRGGDVVLIDDPFASMAEAQSETKRNSVWDWYTGTIYNRLQPGGAIVVINHRMHEDDLSGRLLEQQAAGGDKWDVVSLPATPEKPLWPEWYGKEALDRIKRNTLPRFWSALYEQNPTPDEGTYFLADWLRPYIKEPARDTLRVYGASDYAVTPDGGDYTVHIVVGMDPKGNIYVLDLWRAQTDSSVWVDSFCELVKRYKPIGWAEEGGQIKAGVGPFLERTMREKKAFVARHSFPTKGDKAIRAQSIRGRMAVDGLYVPIHAPWYAALESELLAFPAGANDDQVDALGLIGQLLDVMVAGKARKEDAEPKDRWDKAFEDQESEGDSWKVY